MESAQHTVRQEAVSQRNVLKRTVRIIRYLAKHRPVHAWSEIQTANHESPESRRPKNVSWKQLISTIGRTGKPQTTRTSKTNAEGILAESGPELEKKSLLHFRDFQKESES